jgi:hypothetical protein
MVNAHYVIIYFRAKFSLRFKIRQVTQVARFLLSQALPSWYARSLASDLGKSKLYRILLGFRNKSTYFDQKQRAFRHLGYAFDMHTSQVG